MTVASLWSVLDRAGCGTAVGAREMVVVDDPATRTTTTTTRNPWNYNENTANDTQLPPNDENRQALAVDLSIWICEALTSMAMSNNHADPALHLVYTRTVKLLSLGIKLIFVVEGKRRIRRSSAEQGDKKDKFRKRRSGTAFWNACQSCEAMLKFLGVPVVRAKAEGEALCAFLNQQGIVDGVISNDGDCLLFGAQVLYTRFSIENLERSQVVRYDASTLRAVVVSDERDEQQDEQAQDHGEEVRVRAERAENAESISLSRKDLIAFALLTGSDLAGDGLPKVGRKKAIRFIRKCQLDYPLSKESAAMDELTSWGNVASAFNHQVDNTVENATKGRCCSVCTHPGDKRSHEKNGCEMCGTNPGEPCFNVSNGDKLRKLLRLKALAMMPKFAPGLVLDAYMKPNDNQVPFALAGLSSKTLHMDRPRLGDMLRSSLVVKGRSLETSREFVKQSLARLLARTHLFSHKQANVTEKSKSRKMTVLSRERPVPLKITKHLVYNKTSSYEITWSVNATMTDAEGNDLNGYEFSTIESQTLVESCYPELVEKFRQTEKERKKQGDAETSRRQAFLEQLLNTSTDAPPAAQKKKPRNGNTEKVGKRGTKAGKKRAGFFEKKRARKKPHVGELMVGGTMSGRQHGGEDVQKLMLAASNENGLRGKTTDDFDYSSIEEDSLSSDSDDDNSQGMVLKADLMGSREHEELDGCSVVAASPLEKSEVPVLTPGCHRSVWCDMGIPIKVTPLVSNRCIG